MVPDSANGSAEGASLMREEHIFKVEDRIRRASAGWTRVLACAFEQKGDSQRADLAQIETIFGPVEAAQFAAEGICCVFGEYVVAA